MGGPHFMKIRKKRKLPETNLRFHFEIKTENKYYQNFGYINKYTFLFVLFLHFLDSAIFFKKI